jgi:hypothetical protein
LDGWTDNHGQTARDNQGQSISMVIETTKVDHESINHN